MRAGTGSIGHAYQKGAEGTLAPECFVLKGRVTPAARRVKKNQKAFDGPTRDRGFSKGCTALLDFVEAIR